MKFTGYWLCLTRLQQSMCMALKHTLKRMTGPEHTRSRNAHRQLQCIKGFHFGGVA
jgi:hypothetical protein